MSDWLADELGLELVKSQHLYIIADSCKQYSNGTAKELEVLIADTLLVINVEIYSNIQYPLLLEYPALAALWYKMD